MKLWDKGQPLDKAMEAFTAGEDPALDLHLVPYDCAASKAHARMLAGIGVLTEAELAAGRDTDTGPPVPFPFEEVQLQLEPSQVAVIPAPQLASVQHC